MKRYNKTLKNKLNKRDRIIYGENYKEEEYHAGLRRFHNLTADKLEKLIEQKLAYDFISFGDSPPLKSYHLFSRCFKNEPAIAITLCGYTCDSKRLEISDMEMTTVDTIKVTFDPYNLRNTTPTDITNDFYERFGCSADRFAHIRKAKTHTLYARFN